MTDLKRLWWIPVAGAVVAPLVTWFPMLAYRFPWIGLPQYQAAQGIDFWSSQTFFLAAMTTMAFLIARQDRYLGLAVALAGFGIFWRGANLDPTHSIMFGLGALLVAVMRYTPMRHHMRIASVLAGLGVFELLYVSQQLFLGYDILWGPLMGGQLVMPCGSAEHQAALLKNPQLTCGPIQALGTIGTVDAASAYIAILAPLMPWWLLPLVFLVVLKSHAVSAILALAVGMFIRFRKCPWYGAYIYAGLALLGAYYAAFAKSVNPVMQHMTGRGAIWGFAASDWVRTDPLVGYGLGGWANRIPALQIQHQFAPTKELWREAHNEYLQWIVEAGIIGLILLAMWLWTHRAMFAHPVWGGSLAALGVNALTFFPMHVVQISLVGLILVGLATAQTRTVADLTSPHEWGQEN